MQFVPFITAKAQQCGWQVSKVLSESLVALNFDSDHGTETVYIRPCGQNADGNTILEFTSHGLAVPTDSETAHGFAMMLLERNGEMLMGYWGIEVLEDERYFTVFVSQIANTMDLDEFRAAVRAILAERQRFFKLVQKAAIEF
ncbi:MAG TPA: hypothetical protein VFJ82_01230 [Longimicrobium sp.]|nr:hypothetical protein [Longimicrobium sp.]